jgi:hypothetical protein
MWVVCSSPGACDAILWYTRLALPRIDCVCLTVLTPYTEDNVQGIDAAAAGMDSCVAVCTECFFCEM